MKVCTIGNFPPRKCGIATFTAHLCEAVQQSFDADDSMFIVAMDQEGTVYDYQGKVVFSISEEQPEAYIEAANYINKHSDVVLVEHEFGIFGGKSGLFLLQLVERLHVPFVLTMHTVLKKWDFHQQVIVNRLLLRAEIVVVMSQMARELLLGSQKIHEHKIRIIEHGVPDFRSLNKNVLKKSFGWEKNKIMLTFGLLGRSKGIEIVLRALPDICALFPDFKYVILGKTHPSVVAHEGEDYRDFLQGLAEELGVASHLLFIDEYVSENDLANYLKAADFYVTPYKNKAQVTSGTLVYALASGSVVFSTPYWHAEEALQNNRGVLFPFGDYRALAKLVLEHIENEEMAAIIRENAANYGIGIRWSKCGKKYYSLLKQCCLDTVKPSKNTVIDKLPKADFRHLFHLTDTTGILQHANYSVPDKKLGYCLDDNARALILTLMAYRENPDEALLKLIHVYVSYIVYMQNEDGSFRNFLDYERHSHEHAGSEDSFGRVMWALGYLIKYPPTDALFQLGLDLFFTALKNIYRLNSLRGKSNALIGLYWVFRRFPDHQEIGSLIVWAADQLCAAYNHVSGEEWNWFENILTYDNGILPYALMLAAEVSYNDDHQKIAYQSLDFLQEMTLSKGHLSLIGNEQWMKRGGEHNNIGQQPVDALAMVLAFSEKYQHTKSSADLKNAHLCAEWFLGNNDLFVPLYDIETGGCNDGMEHDGANRNQGAESIISCQLAFMLCASLD